MSTPTKPEPRSSKSPQEEPDPVLFPVDPRLWEVEEARRRTGIDRLATFDL